MDVPGDKNDEAPPPPIPGLGGISPSVGESGLAPALGPAGDPGLAPALAAPWRIAAGDDLAAALADAPPGAELLLGPGDHFLPAPHRLRRGIALVGVGRARTRLHAALEADLPPDATLGFAALMLVVPAGEDGLVLMGGRAELRDCTLRGSAGGLDGLRAGAHTAVEAERLEVLGFAGHGLRVAARASVRLVGGELADNGGFGLLVAGEAEAEGLVARRNGRGGAAAAPGGRLRLAGGTLEANGRRGVVLRAAAGCELRDVAVLNNAGPGVEAVAAAGLVLHGNRCQGNRGGGILLGEATRAEVRENVCDENGGDGIAVLRGATAQLATNAARRNRRYGLWVGAGAEATLADNQAEANREGEVMASWRAVVAHVGQDPGRRGEPAHALVRYAPVDRRAKIASMRDREAAPRPWPRVPSEDP